MRSQSSATFPLLLLFLLSPASTIRLPFLHAQNGPLAPHGVSFVSAAMVNYTIDDTSSLIVYSPSTKWRASTTPCQTCLSPNVQLAYAGTWHDGTHIIPTFDADDPGSTDTDDTPHSTSTSSSPVPTASSIDDDDKGQGQGGGDNDSGDPDSKGKGSSNGRRRSFEHRALTKHDDSDDNPFFTGKLDSDDPGFVDTPVFAQFSFTGSAVYVFALVPSFVAATNSTPTFVNISTTLDNQPAVIFLNAGSPSVAANNNSYQRSVPIFTKTGLDEGPHNLTMNVGPDSVFLLDYIIYSQDDVLAPNKPKNGAPSSSATSTPPSSSSASSTVSETPSAVLSQSTPTTSSHSKSNNVATFAGAVGGSVGLLSVLALALAFSICRRRRLARRRDRAYRESQRDSASISESFHTDASEDGPPMQGPVPFVPRYFPGTVINTAPPPYSPPAPASNSPTSALLGSPETPVPSMSWSSRRFGIILDADTSYADRPPPTPSLGEDGDDYYFAPPPSFPVAISTPVPAILAGLSGLISAPQSPEPRPVSPIVPLLAPPPSSRPQSLHETPVAGPSGSQGEPAATVPSSRVSVHSIQVSSPSPSIYRQPSIVSMRASVRDLSASSNPPPAPITSDSRQHLGEIHGELNTGDDDEHTTRL